MPDPVRLLSTAFSPETQPVKSKSTDVRKKEQHLIDNTLLSLAVHKQPSSSGRQLPQLNPELHLAHVQEWLGAVVQQLALLLGRRQVKGEGAILHIVHQTGGANVVKTFSLKKQEKDILYPRFEPEGAEKKAT